MKNNKGFTLVELICVVVILSLITTIAIVSITKRRKQATLEEKNTLRQTIISGFETYRINNNVLKDTEINIKELDFSTNLSFNGNFCKDKENNNNKIKYVIKGDKDNNNSLEEEFCVKYYCNEVLILDDYSSNSYCE